MASEVKSNLLIASNPNSLESIREDNPTDVTIVEIANRALETSKQMFFPFGELLDQLYLRAKLDKNNIHMFMNLEGDYVVRLSNELIPMKKTKVGEFQLKDFENEYTIEINGHPSFHITPNHLWQKIVSPDKSTYIPGSKKIQKTAIDENGVKAARLVSQRKECRKKIIDEFNILTKLKNERGIVQVFDLVEGSNKTGDWRLTLYEELFEYGDMLALLQNEDVTLTEKDTSDAIEDLLHGVHAIHKKGFVHCDLKAENVLFKRVNGKITAAICDFDLAKSMIDQITMSGTFVTFSPEKLLASIGGATKPWSGHSERVADVWALGVTLYSLRVKGDLPWKCDHDENDHNKQVTILLKLFIQYSDNEDLNLACRAPVGTDKQKSFFLEPNPIENPIDHLIWKMCQFDPRLRPTMEEALAAWNTIPVDKKG